MLAQSEYADRVKVRRAPTARGLEERLVGVATMLTYDRAVSVRSDGPPHRRVAMRLGFRHRFRRRPANRLVVIWWLEISVLHGADELAAYVFHVGGVMGEQLVLPGRHLRCQTSVGDGAL